ncbi:hypothetical protein CCACVL1_19532 [Corchorus capsularis]|uniref:Uncharacterized protein n=1 Tax=Corchorus capsularis TaxID=210143 RepID=A0A1R3HGE9_COCAP|nr:hypothetical protein CCACVL1_19532 [Corchorus capsularis]
MVVSQQRGDDGTVQVGTYFYTAPEIEQGWPKIDEKVRSR